MDAMIQALPFNPAALHGLSERLLRSHFDAAVNH